MTKKIYNNSGSSLAETLVTVLLLTIVLGAVTTGISAARRAYQQIVRKADAMTLLSTIAISMEADFSTASSPVEKQITVTENGAEVQRNVYSFNSGIRGYSIYFDNREDGICAVAQVKGGDDIVIPVATDAAHTRTLRSKLVGDVQFEDDCFKYSISIESKDGTVLIEPIQYVTRISE